MQALRQSYEPLFQAHLMESLKNQPIFQLRTGIPLALEQLGFFEFMKAHRVEPNIHFFHTLSEIIQQINEADPQLASHILESEVGCIGLKSIAILASSLAIEVNTENLYLHLEDWIEELEETQKGINEYTIPTSEYNEIRLEQVILPLYPQLIFGAKTEAEKALVSRLFRVSPLFSHEVHALTFHKDYKKDIFSSISCEHEACDFSKIAERAVHMGLSYNLRDSHEPGYLDYRDDIFGQVQPNALLARFLNPSCKEGKRPDSISHALMYTDITNPYAAALVHTRLQNHLEELGDDRERSMWLTTLASYLGKIEVPQGKQYNRVMAGVALTEIVKHANTDPIPFQYYLNLLQQDSRDGHSFQLKVMTIFNTWFGNSLLLHANHVRGTYSERALTELLKNSSLKIFTEDISSIVEKRESAKMLLQPLSLTKIHPDIKYQLAGVFLDILRDKNRYLRDRYDLEIEAPEAQALVDSGIFSHQHWQQIFRNQHASKIMCKAVMPPEILKGADDRFLEMSLGSGLGL